MKTETCCWASGAMTDLAILVTPKACELLETFPLEATLSGSHTDPSTFRCSDGGSSGANNNTKKPKELFPTIEKLDIAPMKYFVWDAVMQSLSRKLFSNKLRENIREMKFNYL